ncbi:MAG: FG-GAP repeat domain-containing protein [Solirubrobacteraceae bacterium]
MSGVLVTAAVLLAPAGGVAATSGTVFDTFNVESPFVAPGARFPERLAQTGDVTGDGVPDLYASSYVIPVDGKAGAGSVYLYSGADRSLVRTITEPDPQPDSNFGFYINDPGDLNGDGKDDLLAGATARPVFVGKDLQGTANTSPCGAVEPNGCNEGQGRAYAFDGATGRLIFTLDNPHPQPAAGFGGRLAGAGDITGDNVPDITVGAPSNDLPAGCALQTPVAADCRKNEGEAFIFNGRTGSLIRQLNVPAADRLPPATCTPTGAPVRSCGNMGGTVQSPGDVDRDGVPDQIVAAYSLKPTTDRDGRTYLFSGKTGGVLARIDQPAPDTRAFWGLQDIENNSPGDVTGDGVPDIYGNGFLQDGPNGEADAGRSWVFDGAKTVAGGNGVVAREIKDPNPTAGKAWGFTARKTDYNKDGFPDLFVGSLSGNNTQTQIINGRDGSAVLKTLLIPAADIQPAVPADPAVPGSGNTGPTFSQGMAAFGDLNRDGEPDYAVTAHALDVAGNKDQGRFYFYVSNVPPTPTPSPTATPPTIPTATPTPSVVPTPTATPTPRRRPGLSATVRPKRDRNAPYRFTTRGTLTRPSGVSRARGCKGKVRVTVRRTGHGKTLSSRLAGVRSSCAFSSKVTFKSRKRFGTGRTGTLRFTIRFQGNARLSPRTITRTARYGR